MSILYLAAVCRLVQVYVLYYLLFKQTQFRTQKHHRKGYSVVVFFVVVMAKSTNEITILYNVVFIIHLKKREKQNRAISRIYSTF